MCESYLFGKMTHQPFTNSCTTTERLLQLVHTNLCAPFPIPYRSMAQEDFEGSGRSHQGTNFPLLRQHEQYLSGSEPYVQRAYESYRGAPSLHPRVRSSWRCWPSTHQHKSSDNRHLHQSPRSRQASAIHVRPWTNNPWLSKLDGEYKRDTVRTGSELNPCRSEHQPKEANQSWAWGGMFRIQFNQVYCVNTSLRIYEHSKVKSRHYFLHINYVSKNHILWHITNDFFTFPMTHELL